MDVEPTLKTIAKLTGLSQSTVSRALRNDPMQSRQTCARVQKVAKDIGYSPSPLVSALMTQIKRGRKSQYSATIGLIDLFAERDGWRKWRSIPPLVDGFRRRASELKYNTETFWLGQPGMSPKRLVNILRSRGIIGIVIIPPFEMNSRLDMDISGFACATMGYPLKSPNIHRAARDFIKDISIAIDQATQLGYKRLGLAVPSRIEHLNECHWSAGLLSYQQRIPQNERIPILLSSSFENEIDLKKAYTEFKSWYKKHQPDVILSFRHYVPDFLKDMGVDIPKKVGYIDICQRDDQSLFAGVCLQSEKIGGAAADLVVNQINLNERGEPDLAKLTLVHGSWRMAETLRPQT